MLFSLSTIKYNMSYHKAFGSILSALIITIATGCSNNAVDTTTSVDAVSRTQVTGAATVSAASDPAVVKALQANLKASGIEGNVTSAVATEMEGIYWVSAEGLPGFFADKSGQHIIQGEIIGIGKGNPVDISAALVADSAQKALKAVAKKDMIIYPATGATKSVIYAFTDADCGYCRKMHEEMADINARGIEVRYLAWPRSEETIPKMQAVWCSEDRNAAMDQAKMGANVLSSNCSNPVQQQMALGASLGVRGTPAVFTESGEQVGGYLPSAQLAEVVGAL